jgi:UDP-N-acetylglucosamine 2-epimerase (non-hydrolysing)
MKTIVSVCSARPNFVKLAAVHHALQEHGKEFRHVIVHTGQHYDPLLSDVFFEQLKIPQPTFNLGVHGGMREEVIDQTETAFAAVLPEIKPDIVLVYGDVNGALGAARAAKKGGYRLGHVEAGLRSFDASMPEEHNRIEIDQLADLLFVSEEAGMENLEKEGVKGEKFLVGNVMIDTLVRMKPVIDQKPLSAYAGSLDRFAVATLHRPSNVDDPEALKLSLDFLKEINEFTSVLLPAHPRLINAMAKFGIEQPFTLLGPMEYLSFLRHVEASSFVITDSGGIQEEAAFLGKRCYTLRKNTERPSTVESGSNVLIDPAIQADRETVLSFAKSPMALKVAVPDIWDGKAGERIVGILSATLAA